jgi:hypothetical protein
MPAAGLVTLSVHIVARLLAEGEYITAGWPPLQPEP